VLHTCTLCELPFAPDRDEQDICHDCEADLERYGADAHRVILARSAVGSPVLTDLLAGARGVPVLDAEDLDGIMGGRRR
jgi:hypothetical protein